MWLLLTGNQGYPLPSVLNVPQSGNLHDRVTVPTAEIAVAQRAQSVDVSVAPVGAIQQAIKSAFKQRRLVDRPGTTVLSGAIPTAGPSAGGGSGG